MTTQALPKSYTPAESEAAILARWDAARAFHADPNRPTADAPPFCILIPPPNVTAALHLGHAFNNTLQDVLTRYHRMKGYNTLWMPGTDHAGIATQTVVDKRLQTLGEPALKDYKRLEDQGQNGREQFIAKVQAWKDEYEATIIAQLKAIGCSCDFERTRFTMDEICAKAVREAFFRLFKDGLIYRGKRLVNWDPASQTALADDEVEMEEVAGHMYYLRYPIDGDPSDSVTVATTRPETMLGDTAVAINPKDPRAAKYVGKHVRLPIVGRVIPIIADDYVVRPVQYGGDESDAKARIATGFLKVTPAHDDNDYQIGQRHNLPMVNIFAPDASISDKHGWDDVSEEARPFLGLSREECRKQIVEWFKKNNLLEDVKPYTHSVGHSYRSHVPIEPYLSDQWYVKVTDNRLRGEALRAMAQIGDLHQGGTGILPVHTSPSQIVSDHLTIHHRNLPHWQIGGSTYFVTFRLLKGELSEGERAIVLDACRHWHGEKLHLHLATVMPDHVHLLITPLKKKDHIWHSLPELMHSIKSHTGREIQKRRGQSGPFWQDEYFDRIIRDEHEFHEKWNYMWRNPVAAGLVESPDQYDFTIRGEEHSHGQNARATDHAHASLPYGRGSSEEHSGDGALQFFPERYAKTFQTWHENIRDWCISRQIWWGHRIPVWSRKKQFGTEEDMREFVASTSATVWEIDGKRCAGSYSHDVNTLIEYVCPSSDFDDVALSQLTNMGFQQDPDVLDTWFSSALWPISTMGWPDPSAFPREIPEGETLLNTFNPSTVLFTAREIITLWVSRMVMFNRYFRDGKLPFEHVYIHAMIQDGHGQKMSKSLGNGVDPRDIIHSHGADALRFICTQIATATQDVRLPVDMVCPHCAHVFDPKQHVTSAGHRVALPRQECPSCKKPMVSGYGAASAQAAPTAEAPLARNTSSRFDLGRNFANKVWNATRFALSNLTIPPTDASLHITTGNLPLVDRWMINRLHKALHTIEDALAEYQFNVYAVAMYDLVWRDFCDWYLEAIKPTVKTDAAQQQVLRTVLNAILRLLHPICPFVTETLWPHVREAGRAGLDGIALEDGELLATTAWPDIACRVHDDNTDADFARVQTLVETIRQLRSDHQVPPKKLVRLMATPNAAAIAAKAPDAVKFLAGLSSIDAFAGRDARSLIFTFEGEEQALADVVDEVDSGKEIQRLEKQIADLEKQRAGMAGKLSNPGYVNKAKPELVDETRRLLAETEAELAARRTALQSLQSAAG